MKKFTFLLLLSFSINANAQTPCTNGFAGIYPCENIDLMAHLSFLQLGGNSNTQGNDSWGWTDPMNGKEYAIMCCNTHTAFVDITNPTSPIYLGKVVSTNNISSTWRDAKVYNNYVFIVSEASGHGMQVFDLKRLRNVTSPQVFSIDAFYSGFGNCHNIAINEVSGFAYCIGSNTFSGGPHVVNIQNPTSPQFAFGYSSQAYTHDAQIINYTGPDTEHIGKEIYFGANENKVVVIDVTNKNNPILLSTFVYPNVEYTHQGWLTTDNKYWIVGDELDETSLGFNTKSIIIDMTNLDAPVLKGDYFGTTPAIDHNGYTLNNEYYLANYTAGLRIMNTSNIETSSNMNEIAYFDTFPSSNSAQFNGAWSTYPYFASGNILISDIESGLFIVKKNAALSFQDFEKDSFNISPNPSTNYFTVSSKVEIQNIEIIDILGKKIKEFKNLNVNNYTINSEDFIAGMYFIKINNATTLKLIVK